MGENEYVEVARFHLRATGGMAEYGQIPVSDLITVLQAIANIMRRSTLLALDRPHPSPDDLKSVQIRVLASERGSYVQVIAVAIATAVLSGLAKEVAVGAFGSTAKSIGEGAREAIFGKPDPASDKRIGVRIGEAIVSVYNSLLGKTEVPSEQRIEPRLPWLDQIVDVG